MRNEKLFRVFPELREAVVSLVAQGHSILYLSRRLRIPDATIYLWQNRVEAKNLLRETEEFVSERDDLMDLITELSQEEPVKLKRGRKPSKEIAL